MCVFKNHAFIYFLRPPSWSGTLHAGAFKSNIQSATKAESLLIWKTKTLKRYKKGLTAQELCAFLPRLHCNHYYLYLQDDAAGRDVDPGVENHHDRQRQVEGAHRRIQLQAMTSAILGAYAHYTIEKINHWHRSTQIAWFWHINQSTDKFFRHQCIHV